MISRERECIFVHIPKCAGTSIESVIWPGPRDESQLWMGFVDSFHNDYQTGGLQHLKAHQVRHHVGAETFGRFFKFAFVRHPYDRALSQYGYMQRRPDLRRFLGMSDDATFSQYLDLIQQTVHVQWEPQHSFCFDPESSDSLLDFIGRFESFSRDAQRILRRLGIHVDEVPHLNRGPTATPSHRVSRRDRAAVESIYAADFERFSY